MLVLKSLLMMFEDSIESNNLLHFLSSFVIYDTSRIL